MGCFIVLGGAYLISIDAKRKMRKNSDVESNPLNLHESGEPD